ATAGSRPSSASLPNSDVYHLAYYGYEQTVIDSQLVTPALRLLQDGVRVHPVFLEDAPAWFSGKWRPYREALAAAGLTSTFLPRVPRNLFGLNTHQLSRFLRRIARGAPIVL